MRARARRHSHHDARVALPHAHVGRARDAGRASRRSSSTRSTRSSPSKRGAHLALSLERLEALRGAGAPPPPAHRSQRDAAAARRGRAAARRLRRRARRAPVTVVDAGARKTLELVGRGDEAGRRRRRGDPRPAGRADGPLPQTSVWPQRARARRRARARAPLDDRLRQQPAPRRAPRGRASNDVAGEEIALAHHGSLAREKRTAIEDRLKRGELRAIVATSSLELGIDMGAVDLVVQIEAPPSVASGLQRIGRACHGVGGVPRGVLLPKHRHDLLACAAATASDARGRGRGDVLSAQPARRPRAADRRDRRRSRPLRRGRRSTSASAAPRRSPSCRAARSRACSTC